MTSSLSADPAFRTIIVVRGAAHDSFHYEAAVLRYSLNNKFDWGLDYSVFRDRPLVGDLRTEFDIDPGHVLVDISGEEADALDFGAYVALYELKSVVHRVEHKPLVSDDAAVEISALVSSISTLSAALLRRGA